MTRSDAQMKLLRCASLGRHPVPSAQTPRAGRAERRPVRTPRRSSRRSCTPSSPAGTPSGHVGARHTYTPRRGVGRVHAVPAAQHTRRSRTAARPTHPRRFTVCERLSFWPRSSRCSPVPSPPLRRQIMKATTSWPMPRPAALSRLRSSKRAPGPKFPFPPQWTMARARGSGRHRQRAGRRRRSLLFLQGQLQ